MNAICCSTGSSPSIMMDGPSLLHAWCFHDGGEGERHERPLSMNGTRDNDKKMLSFSLPILFGYASGWNEKGRESAIASETRESGESIFSCRLGSHLVRLSLSLVPFILKGPSQEQMGLTGFSRVPFASSLL